MFFAASNPAEPEVRTFSQLGFTERCSSRHALVYVFSDVCVQIRQILLVLWSLPFALTCHYHQPFSGRTVRNRSKLLEKQFWIVCDSLC